MPSAAPELGSFQYVPETKENLDWADLPTIDLALFDDPEGKKQLVQTLIKAFEDYGFFYVKNFGVAQERVNRQFALGKAFYDLPLEEKLKYMPNLDAGEYNGYRPAGRRDIGNGLKDRTEVFNIPKPQYFPRDQPELIKQNMDEIEQFAKDLHTYVLDPLFVLFSLALELPEDYFSNIHRYEEKSECHYRYMKYSAYNEDETALLKDGLWGRGHTDLGSITLLFRQPVAALQILQPNGDGWKWVKPQDATLTVNTCDALSFLTGGWVRSTIHRVAVPPKDQRHVDRLGVLYFARPANDVVLHTIKESPALQKRGLTENVLEKAEREGKAPVPTMGEWTYIKQKWQQSTGGYKHGKELTPGFVENRYD